MAKERDIAHSARSDMAGSALPAPIEGYWFGRYSGPSIASTQSSATAANYIAWFAAVGTGAKDTQLTFSGVGTAAMRPTSGSRKKMQHGEATSALPKGEDSEAMPASGWLLGW
jgi:hypothetical protein